MSEALKKYFVVLEHLAQVNNRKDRKVLLRVFSRNPLFIKALREICSNTINGGLSLSQKDKNRLRKHKDIIVCLATKNKAVKRKLIQTGSGFLSVILPLVASVVGALLNGSQQKAASDDARK